MSANLTGHLSPDDPELSPVTRAMVALRAAVLQAWMDEVRGTVRRAAEAHGGSVLMSSSVEDGTVFVIDLPTAAGRSLAEYAPTPSNTEARVESTGSRSDSQPSGEAVSS